MKDWKAECDKLRDELAEVRASLNYERERSRELLTEIERLHAELQVMQNGFRSMF